ncbi:MAG: molybdopterin adenylyltransferase [Myxococcales bacterium]|nr:molybdopterin adenylyltransferase [Myxococcales bacterium]
MSDVAKIGVVTVSDRASAGVYEDRSGPAIEACLQEFLSSSYETVYRLVTDDQPDIEKALIELADDEGCCLIVTTGGTGPAKRDVTVEATLGVIEKLMPGFGEEMRRVSLRAVPTAILSRQEAGIRGQSLIVNLPGSPKAIRECLIAVFPAIPYCIDLLEGPYLTTHTEVVAAFRPKK